MKNDRPHEAGAKNFRSPNLMNPHDTALLIVDVQEKLVPHVLGYKRLVWNIGRLIVGANTLGMKICVTEQYPKGLGKTVQPIVDALKFTDGDFSNDKTMFSCRECEGAVAGLSDAGVHKLLLVGIETHVCIAQSAMDLMAAGFSVYVCVDAVGSRSVVDHETAIRRLENAGATPTTAEAALFEWCVNADRPEFKSISNLVRETGPN